MSKIKKIEMPTPEEKRRSIDIIINALPEKQRGYFYEVGKLLRLIGLRGLFFGVGDAAFLAVISAVIINIFMIGIRSSAQTIYTAMFFASPLTYILLYSLTMWKENLTGTLELHKTCRITPRHITAVRMMFFGGASMTVNGLICIFIFKTVQAHDIPLSFLRLLEISFCSLFIFAAVLLFIMLKRGNKTQGIFAFLWCVSGIAAVMLTEFEMFLRNLPAYVLIGAAVIFAILFILETRIYFKKGEKYAVS